MNVKELERLYESVWREDGAKESADGWNGSGVGVKRNGVKKRKRASWRIVKQQISPRGLVRYENHIFRIEQRFGELYITPNHRYIRISEKGRKTIQEAREISFMTYEQFFQQYLSHMQTWSVRDINGTRISGVQQRFLRSIVEENILPMTGDMVRRC